ncbi:hypothetical protein [Glycomyces sp. NRRL B-16210]|uniref:hypothetical protein n=1 Tax=Glycomyces sp. NRRL B-16210 TaxID=1463821 RepID=UPI0004BEC6E3|nr:hypothetical protein [Glycomyces sp. NRRL B-16210]
MSVNVHLYLNVNDLESPDEADRIGTEVNRVLEHHRIESWMEVTIVHEPPAVIARSDPAIIVSRFSLWSKQVEIDIETSIRAIAPKAHISLEWDHPDPL